MLVPKNTTVNNAINVPPLMELAVHGGTDKSMSGGVQGTGRDPRL